MNNSRRKNLKSAIELIEKAMELIETVKLEEEESFYNLSENLQESERGQKMNENFEDLDSLLIELESTTDSINEIITK
jgi:hypothetical protein